MSVFTDDEQPAPPVRTSAKLRDFAERHAADRVSVGDLRDLLGDRAYGVLILLSGQLAFGLPAPWFPRWMSHRSIRRSDFDRALGWGLSYLEQVERLLRPRPPVLSHWTAERALGVMCLVLAIVISLPIPFGNAIPAIAVCILSLALIEKDGVAYVLGVLMACIAPLLVGGMVYGVAKALVFFVATTIS